MNATLVSGEARNPRFGSSRVSVGRPLIWLSLGWQDMRRHWGASLGYGALTVAFGWTLADFFGHPSLLHCRGDFRVPFGGAGGSAGLAEMSRRYSLGQSASFDDSLDGFSRNESALIWFGTILALCAIVWFVTSAVMLETVFHIAAPISKKRCTEASLIR